jgi:glycosyltransferase involved in cell wall biosynthesis
MVSKKILIAPIATFLRPSGAVRVILTLLDELLEREYKVALALLYKPNLEEVSREFFDRPLSKRIHVHWLFPSLDLPVTYQRLFLSLPLMKAVRKENPDIVFVDHSSYKPLRNMLRGRKVVHYVHFPPLSYRLLKSFPEVYRESLSGDFNRFPKNIYWNTYALLEKPLIVDYGFADVLCANSSFTAGIVKRIWNRSALVIYPPVALKDFEPLPKRNVVTSIGRIDPDKHFEDLIEAVSICETKPIVRIIGGLGAENMPYLIRLKSLIEKLNLNSRVSVETNVPFHVVKESLGMSKIYVHAKHYEHFGISVVEAMASGCVPIVHRSGGPFLDIIDRGKYGFSFSSTKELAQDIDKLMQTDTSKLAESCICRAKIFGEDNFRKGIMDVIEGQH